VRVVFNEDVTAVPSLPPRHNMVEKLPRVWKLEVEGWLGPLLKVLEELPVKDLQIEEPGLEDVLIKYYRGSAQ
jgi:ABC-type uncharacterized transport system ATPase subunit